MSSEWKEIGSRLKALREAKGISSQTSFARLLGAEVNQYGNWERGVGPITVEYAIRVCVFTGATLDYIYRGDLSSLPANLMMLVSGSSAEETTETRRASTSRKRSSK